MDDLLKKILAITEEASDKSRNEERVSNLSYQLVKHMIMVHHNPPENRTSNHWSSEANAFIKGMSKFANKLKIDSIKKSIKSCGIESKYGYESIHKDASSEKTDVKFTPPNRETHLKILGELDRISSELSKGNIPTI